MTKKLKAIKTIEGNPVKSFRYKPPMENHWKSIRLSGETTFLMEDENANFYVVTMLPEAVGFAHLLRGDVSFSSDAKDWMPFATTVDAVVWLDEKEQLCLRVIGDNQMEAKR
jgi:hypothetical protein